MGLLLPPAGAVSVYAEKRAFKDHAHQSHRMGAVFRRAVVILTGPTGQDEVRDQRVLRDIGREALGENGDWLLAHRDRPIEPIKGGGFGMGSSAAVIASFASPAWSLHHLAA
ncbi:hypothetical protein [Rhodospira trueperi]|nr:hypothetical protein [Rhodospira trueperi]